MKIGSFIHCSTLSIAVLLLLSSCSETGKSSENRTTSIVNDTAIHSIVDFDSFLLTFNSDCDFQKKHVIFPLQSISNMEWETNDYDTSFISRKEYECIALTSPKSNILPGVSTLKISKAESDLVIVSFGIDDTGVLIEYYFQKKASNWQLFKIVDEST